MKTNTNSANSSSNSSSLRNLIHHGANESRTSDITRNLRWEDSRTNHFGTTQVWSWGKCDAIVVLANSTYNSWGTTSYVVIRIGTKVQIFEGSLKDAMAHCGYNIDKYRIVTQEMLAEERAKKAQ